jgi:hypothetical protein
VSWLVVMENLPELPHVDRLPASRACHEVAELVRRRTLEIAPRNAMARKIRAPLHPPGAALYGA